MNALAFVEGMMARDPDSQPLEPFSAAGVVHDLGNLIQVASAAVSLIARNPEMRGSERGPMLARANESLDRAGALVRQALGLMLDRAWQAEVANVATCLLEVKALVDAMGEDAVVLDVWLDVDLPEVRCDPLRLQNAVLNLVFNARDAMPDGGPIVLRAVALDRGSQVEIGVDDRGIGMSPEAAARAFEPFFTTKTDGMGGVGLPTVERFVRDADGEISIRSEPGRGTTVTMVLPSAQIREQNR